MDISKYTAWFHDGDFVDISHDLVNQTMIVSMISAQILDFQDEFDNKIKLSSNHTIAGKLHVFGITNIMVNKTLFTKELKKLDADADLLDFEVMGKTRIELGIRYAGLKERDFEHSFQYVTIECENHCWENIPSLDRDDQ